MRALLDKYSAHRQVAEQIEKDIHIYEKAQKECLEILKEYKDEEKFRITYCKLFEKCRSAEESMTLFDRLYTILQANTDFIYADLCFFDKVVEKLATEPCVCVFAGGAHARAVTLYLQAYGCELVSEKDCIALTTPLLSLIRPNSVEIDCLDEQTIEQFLEPLQGKKALPAACTHCGKAKNNLLVCSRCKAKAYCDQACQKADWSIHKALCKPVGSQKK